MVAMIPKSLQLRYVIHVVIVFKATVNGIDLEIVHVVPM